VTWNERKPGWVSRVRPRGAPDLAASLDQPKPDAVDVAVMVPAFPMFSPAAIAALLHLNRGMIHYYLEKQKLEFIRDNIGERYVLRGELIRFIREYLRRAVYE